MWPIKVAFLHFIFYSTFLSFLTLCNPSSILTCSVQLIFSVLVQHHISKVSRYFWSTFRSVQGSTPYKSLLQIWHSTSFLLQFKCNLLVKRDVFLLNVAFTTAQTLHLENRNAVGIRVSVRVSWGCNRIADITINSTSHRQSICAL